MAHPVLSFGPSLVTVISHVITPPGVTKALAVFPTANFVSYPGGTHWAPSLTLVSRALYFDTTLNVGVPAGLVTEICQIRPVSLSANMRFPLTIVQAAPKLPCFSFSKLGRAAGPGNTEMAPVFGFRRHT